jgi:hypothetical protein
MADPKFEYPDTTTPTTTIEFPRGGFRGDIPTGEREFNQTKDSSQAGEIMTMSHGTNYRRFILNSDVAIADQGGNTADISGIDTFINTTINGTLNPFYYTPRDGATAFKVKLMNPNKIFVMEYVTYHRLRFEMIEVD